MADNPKLSLLCVTRGEAHATPLIRSLSNMGQELGAQVVFAGSVQTLLRLTNSRRGNEKLVRLSHDYATLEEALPEAIRGCDGEYVLRVDDDEALSEALKTWLFLDRFSAAPSWLVPLVHLWKSPFEHLSSSPYWPNYEVRLHRVDTPPDERIAALVPAVLKHYKFILRSKEERELMGEGPWHVPESVGGCLRVHGINNAERLALKSALAVQHV